MSINLLSYNFNKQQIEVAGVPLGKMFGTSNDPKDKKFHARLTTVMALATAVKNNMHFFLIKSYDLEKYDKIHNLYQEAITSFITSNITIVDKESSSDDIMLMEMHFNTTLRAICAQIDKEQISFSTKGSLDKTNDTLREIMPFATRLMSALTSNIDKKEEKTEEEDKKEEDKKEEDKGKEPEIKTNTDADASDDLDELRN